MKKVNMQLISILLSILILILVTTETSFAKEKVDCNLSCSRPMSDAKFCEKQGEDSIGCINYTRCVEKCQKAIEKVQFEY